MKFARTLEAPRPPAEGEAAVALAHDATRLRVVRSILVNGPSTAAELADRLDLTTAAVRRHLGGLEEAGQLTSREQRVYGVRGRGRPARVFVLTDAGRAAFESHGDDIAVAALDYLARRMGPGAVSDFADEVLGAVASRFDALTEDAAGGGDPAEHLVRAFNDSGYAASLHAVASGRQLCQHHCPLAHVARAHPELCIAETRIISRLLGTHVQRLATIAAGDEVCTTHLPRPLTDQDLTTTEGKSS